MSFVAICDGLNDPIWATGESEGEACASLWERVSQYLKDRQAPETSEMTAQELNDYFGAVILDLSRGGGFFRN
jgi:hypothetical protein